MNPNLIGLRKSLAANLRRLIDNQSIEEKELAAFDLLVSRRQFLVGAELRPSARWSSPAWHRRCGAGSPRASPWRPPPSG
jgi:hypothetical protein